jgi:hypothetical protein
VLADNKNFNQKGYMKIFFTLSVLSTVLSFASDVEEKATPSTQEVAVESTQPSAASEE